MSGKANRLERELNALIPVALTVARNAKLSNEATAKKIINLVMLCARPLIESEKEG